jgi:predicted neuraminidase
MSRVGGPRLLRVSLLGLIALSVPLKTWLEQEWVVPFSQQNKGPSARDSTSSQAGMATGMVQASNQLGAGSKYDLSLPGLSLPTPANSQANHSPSLAALGDGALAMSWFGGSREGARDVKIFFAKFHGTHWSEGRAIMGTDQLMQQTGRYLTKLGNPMLYFDGERLHCWFVSVSLGGWGGARLNHMSSVDGGESWSEPRLLVASPFLNVSTLVRSTALPLMPQAGPVSPAPQQAAVSRETLLPAYFELSHKYPVFLRVDINSRILDRYPFGGRTGLLQPSVVRLPSADTILKASPSAEPAPNMPERKNLSEPLIAFFRRGLAVSEAKVFTSQSLDQGKTWSEAQALGIPNGDASIVAWADQSRIWLVANPELGSRRSIASYSLPYSSPFPPDLALAPAQILDEVPATLAGHQEFSYPSFARTQDGRLHLVYTADGRKRIRHRIWAPQPMGDTATGKKP